MYQEYLELHIGQVEMVSLNDIIGQLKQWLKDEKFPLEKQYFGIILHLGLGRMILQYPNDMCIHMNGDTL